MSNSNFHFQNDQGYNSRGNQNYEGFNQDSSYRSQYNDQEVEENSSPSSIYTKYLQLQIRMLKQTASQQGPSINSDEFSASQSCSANSSQLGYIQTTTSSVMTLVTEFGVAWIYPSWLELALPLCEALNSSEFMLGLCREVVCFNI